MSGIAAIVKTEGSADRAVLSRMLESMSSRGPDGASLLSAGPAALGFLALHTTPESLNERQPYIDPRSSRVVVFDGRLDNRCDLLEALDGAVSLHDGDAAFVAAAFDKWGIDAASHLIGDFALAVWDPHRRRLFGARDVMGVRPFCYARGSDGSLLVASEMRGLLATRLVDDGINEARVLEFLSERGYHQSETQYTAIVRLPPAHALVAEDGAVRTFRFWDFGEGRSPRYRRDAEYAEHLRHLLQQSVRAASRTIGPVGIFLSGGVDSSALTAIAAHDGIDCEAFSVVCPGQPHDESHFIRAVSTHCGVRVTELPYDSTPADWYIANARDYADLPEYPNGTMLDELRARGAASGVRVMLTGCGGDEWLTGSRFHYADWLRDGDVVRVIRQFGSDLVAKGPRRAANYLAMCGVWPVLPQALRRSVKRVVKPKARQIVPDWIASDAAARTSLESRIAFKVTPRAGERFAQAEMRLLLAIGVEAHSQEMDDRSMTRGGVEHRHPFFDRRIIEFAYGLPEDQRWRGPYIKHVLRAAVPELPDAVRWRRDKAEFSDVITDGVQRIVARPAPRLLERDWIVPGVVADMRDRFQRAIAARDRTAWQLGMPLWMIFAVETWLESLETRSRHDRYTEAAAAAYA